MPAISRYMSRQPWTIHRTASLDEAKQVMLAHEIRHLPVLEDGALVGILSERDIFFLQRLAHRDTFAVEDAMQKDVFTATVDDPVDAVVETMAINKYGSAVVMNRQREVEGIFTTVDGMEVLVDVLRRATC